MKVVCPKLIDGTFTQFVETTCQTIEKKMEGRTGMEKRIPLAILFAENALKDRFERTHMQMAQDLEPIRRYLKSIEKEMETIVAFAAYVRHRALIDERIFRDKSCLSGPPDGLDLPAEFAYNMGYLLSGERIGNSPKRMMASLDLEHILNYWKPGAEWMSAGEHWERRRDRYQRNGARFLTYGFGNGTQVELRVCWDVVSARIGYRPEWISLVTAEGLKKIDIEEKLAPKRGAIVVHDSFDNVEDICVPSPHVWTPYAYGGHERFEKITGIVVERE